MLRFASAVARSLPGWACDRSHPQHTALVIGIGVAATWWARSRRRGCTESLGTEFELGGVAGGASTSTPTPARGVSRRSAAARDQRSALLADEHYDADGPGSPRRGCDHLGRATVLIDVTGGPRAVAAGIAAAAGLACDLAIYVDVGGDVLARGDEPGLASPLCDAVMLAGAVEAGRAHRLGGRGVRPGCDGELTAREVLDRVAELGAAGGWLGTRRG